jgi:hypothetical protein
MHNSYQFHNIVSISITYHNTDITGFDLISFIFVHGLNPVNHTNHEETTWSHTNGKLWPKDFLPQNTPRSRILIFGYNSNVVFNVSQKGFRDHANRLLECLSVNRRETGEKNRPIIFIGHSLGGLIIKQVWL